MAEGTEEAMATRGRQRIILSEKYCKTCGKLLERKKHPSGNLETITRFSKRLFCSSVCSGIAKRNNPEKLGWSGAHATSSRRVPVGPCAICGTPDAKVVHHINKNEQDNSPDNLVRLCHNCHMKQHPRTKTVVKPCKICDRPQKAHDLCNMHYIRSRKYGDPTITKRKGSIRKDHSQPAQIPLELGD